MEDEDKKKAREFLEEWYNTPSTEAIEVLSDLLVTAFEDGYSTAINNYNSNFNID